MNKEKLVAEARKVGWAVNLADQNGDIDYSLAEDVRYLIECINKLDEPQKPVVPKFVANWYEENLSGGYTDNRNKFSGNDVFRVIQDVLKTNEGIETWGDYGIDKEITAWAEENEEDFIHLIANCSYKDGYEVEKEKKYYVDLDTAAYVAKWNGDNQVGIYTDGISGSDEFEFHLTEKEIKDYDKRYWAFAEEVTE